MCRSLKIDLSDNMRYIKAKKSISFNQASIAHLLSVGLLICRPGFESGRELSFLLKTLEIPKCWINVHNISGILGPRILIR